MQNKEQTQSQMIDPSQKVSVHPTTGRIHVETVNTAPSMTDQQWAKECDINNIMKKYSTTGEFTHLTSKQGVYADFSNITDYQGMLETVNYADQAFSSLPAETRLRFKNNPHELLQFVQDPQNYDEGVKLGLINQRTPSTPITNDKPNDDIYEEITTTVTKKPKIKPPST